MRVRDFLILSVLIIGLINFTFIGAYYVYAQYGSVTLNPGEKYIVNIPFFGDSESPVICGVAKTTSGKLLQGVNVSVYYYNNTALINKSVTDSNGEYCVYLPKITSSKKYNIFIEYNNQTSTGSLIKLASNDYTLDFEDNLIFSKTNDKYAVLQGTITNEDAEIENGRFEIKMGQRVNSTWKYSFGDYSKYSLNIEPNEVYNVPNDELNFSWNTTSLELGEYKFLIKTSFNAKEKTSVDVYFNITE